MSIFRLSRAVTCLGAWTLAIAGVSTASADGLRDGIDRLLDRGAALTPAGLAESTTQYAALKRIAPEDARVEYAGAIVLLHQRRYADALPVLSHYIRANPADLEAACWYAWALVQCRRYDDALAAAGHIGRRAADERLASEETREQAATFLGQLLGYFERVKPGGTTPARISDVKNELLSSLSGDLLESLDKGRTQVAAHFDALANEREAQLAGRAAESTRQHETAASSLEANRQVATERQATRDASAERFNEAARELEVVQQQLASLGRDRTLLSAQILATQERIYGFYRETNIDIPGIQGNVTANSRIVEQRTTTTRFDPADAAAVQQLAFALAGLQKQAFDMDRKLLSLTNRANELRTTGQQQSTVAAQSAAEASKAAKRAERMEKHVMRLEKEKPAGGSMTAQMRSLSTYLPFAYDAERARVLGWFDAK